MNKQGGRLILPDGRNLDEAIRMAMFSQGVRDVPVSRAVEILRGIKMDQQSWSSIIYNNRGVAGPTLTAAAEALICNDFSVPANYMYPGRMLRATMMGKASNAVTTPGTLTMRSRWGGLSGTVLAASAALAQNTAAQTDKTWWLSMLIQCVSDGTSGTFLTWGLMHRGNCAAGAVGDITPDLIPASSPAVVTVDTTVAKLLSFTAQPSLTTASFTMMTYLLESLN